MINNETNENQPASREQIILKKAQVFFDEKTIVHLSLSNGTFYNGRLFSVNENYLEIHDRKFGRIKVFLIEIKHIEEFEVAGE